MVQIHTLSVADFKHTMRNNDLYDSTIESMPELAVISIANSFDDFNPDDIFSNGPSSRWFSRRHRNVLNMTFDDITSPEKWQLLSQFGKTSAGKDYILFDQDTIFAVYVQRIERGHRTFHSSILRDDLSKFTPILKTLRLSAANALA